ncbi:sialate O-acetylesterase [Lactococcus kimchii]|uniref:sialate O-acetylesterase n=1 Tax=Lactococcus sp. S-13 TaxID=2507158 RepID=UPI001022C0E5|nr:sialate O-acetylesterase [Lactococcus sp. S-13]RZI48343.1 9-O-acetylesterase [Lactococcus sp. S-13]
MKKGIFIPFLLRSGAILQRNIENLFWGYTSPRTEISLSFEKFRETAKSNDEGYFSFSLPAHRGSEDLDFTLWTDEEIMTLKNIAFGDLFLLGGQSNMQLGMGRLKTLYSDELENANNIKIRFFQVPQQPEFNAPRTELYSGKWKYAIGADLEELSGIGYFFAKRHYEKVEVPVGLISTAVGGTPINSWLSEQSLKTLNLLPENFESLKNDDYIEVSQELDDDYQAQYLKKLDETDKGLKENYQTAEFDDNLWKEVPLNQEWQDLYRYPGVIWLRKRLKIPIEWIGEKAKFRLGTFSDADEIFVNGKKVGSTDYKYPPRNYPIEKLSEAITIAIRLKIFNFPGGIRADKDHLIIVGDKEMDLNQAGLWKIKRSNWMPEKKEQFFIQYKETGLFNGMIAPLKNLKFSAILWYQGESDAWHPQAYGLRFCKLIKEWRNLFKQNELPFLYVQLPNCGTEIGALWSEIRVEQEKALSLAHTAMVVSLGYGEDNDLHPLNKKGLADELYGSYEKLEFFPTGYCTGPRPRKLQYSKENKEIHVSFQTYGESLSVEKNGYFEILTEGRKTKVKEYQVIDNDNLRIRLPDDTVVVNGERWLSYNWSNTPVPFIKNKIGTAAVPFKIKF